MVNVTVSAADFKQLVLKPYSEAWTWHAACGWGWDLCHVGKYQFPDQSGIKSQLTKYMLKSNTHSHMYIYMHIYAYIHKHICIGRPLFKYQRNLQDDSCNDHRGTHTCLVSHRHCVGNPGPLKRATKDCDYQHRSGKRPPQAHAGDNFTKNKICFCLRQERCALQTKPGSTAQLLE